MRLLHTADWHVNDRLGRIDRTPELRAATEHIAGLCKSEKIDVLLIAGDLFSELARPDALKETIRHWQECFGRFLSNGGTILSVTGNHDSEIFCQTLRHAMTLAAGEIENPGDTLLPGRFYLATKPTLLKLHDIQFALMPWPTLSQYPSAARKSTSPDEKTKSLAQAFNQSLQQLPIDWKIPAVLVAHIQASGEVYGSPFKIDPLDNVTIDTAEIAGKFTYAALGHVHKPGMVAGQNHVRYSGSIARLDLGEKDDEKGVLVFELDKRGLVGDIKTLPIQARRVYEILVTDPIADIKSLKEKYPKPEEDIVSIKIQHSPSEHHLEETLNQLDELFPKWYQRDWDYVRTDIDTKTPEFPVETKAFAVTVREYVHERLVSDQMSDEDKLSIQQMLEKLLAEESA